MDETLLLKFELAKNDNSLLILMNEGLVLSFLKVDEREFDLIEFGIRGNDLALEELVEMYPVGSGLRASAKIFAKLIGEQETIKIVDWKGYY